MFTPCTRACVRSRRRTSCTIMPRFFVGKNIGGKKEARGQNYSLNGSQSVHAEMDALDNLRQKNYLIGNKAMNLLVIRLTKTGKLGESRPCYHCLQRLNDCGVKIKYVYYSTADGRIMREKLSDMIDSPKTYVSLGNRRRILKNQYNQTDQRTKVNRTEINIEMLVRRTVYANGLII